MTQPDVKIQVKPGQRILIHDGEGVPVAALIVDLEKRHPRQRAKEIGVTFRSPHLITYYAQEWVHPEDGDEI